jgi:CIC family chloride channel protein
MSEQNPIRDLASAWMERVNARLPDRDRTRLLGYSAVVGVVGGASAVGFELAMDAVATLALGSEEPALVGVSGWRLAMPVVTALLGGALGVAATRAHKPRGIPDVIGAVRGEPVPLDARDGALSVAAALLAIGGGQSAGREGPIVMLAGSVAGALGERLALPPHAWRVLVAAGAAAGIAASFNSPLGGAFFAMEVLLGSFAVDAFAPTVVASVAGTVVGQSLLGDRLALSFPEFSLAHPRELLVYPLLGVACGLVTVALRSALRRVGQGFERLPLPEWGRPAVGGVAVASLAAVGLPHVMGNGYALLDALAAGTVELGPAFLAGILVAKLATTALAYSGRSGGGIFAPTLFLGAITGQLVGEVVGSVAPRFASSPGVLATVGMGAVAAAVAHAPVTMALMVAEMTGNYAIVLPLLVTIAIALLVSVASDRSSLYVQVLLDRGLLAKPERDHHPVDGLRVSHVTAREGWVSVGPDAEYDEMVARFLERSDDELFVVQDGRPLGVVDIQDLKHAMVDPARRPGTTARGILRSVPTVRPEETLASVMETFFRTGLEVLPVVDAGGHLIGVVSERAVVGALERTLATGTPPPAPPRTLT